MTERLVGAVSHYFGKPGVAGIELTAGLAVGDTIHIQGHTSDFTQQVDSIQIEHETVDTAVAGDSIGVKVLERVRQHDKVYVVTED
jgi:translation elongation factor EF-1alpha